MDAQVITIANRLAKSDSITGLDVWYKCFLHDIKYSIERVTDVNGSQVSMGQAFTILIPFDDKYKSYDEWRNLENKDSYYTLSQGDYIFLKEISEDFLPNSIIQLKNKHKGMACEVRSIIEVPKRYGATIRLKVSGV